MFIGSILLKVASRYFFYYVVHNEQQRSRVTEDNYKMYIFITTCSQDKYN